MVIFQGVPDQPRCGFSNAVVQVVTAVLVMVQVVIAGLVMVQVVGNSWSVVK